MVAKSVAALIAAVMATVVIGYSVRLGGGAVVAGAILILPLVSLVRHVFRPTEEQKVAPWRSLVAPSLIGLAAATIGGLVFRWTNVCPGECVSMAILAAFVVPPALIIACGVALFFTKTPRWWQTSLLGITAAIIMVFTVGRVTAYGLLLFVLAGGAGMLWSALVLGGVRSAAGKLAVYGLIIVLIPATGYLERMLGNGPIIDGLRRTGVPLLAPELPGYVLSSVWGETHGRSVRMTLSPADGRERARLIHVEGMLVPQGFDPPGDCGPASADYRVRMSDCAQAGPDLWRREANDFARRYGDALYLVQGDAAVDEEVVRRAALSFRPVTAGQLARLITPR